MSLLSLTTVLLVALSTIPNEGFAFKLFHNFQEENGLFSANQMIVEAIAGGEGGEEKVQTRQKRSPESYDKESKVEYVDEDGVKHTKENEGLKKLGEKEEEGMKEERKRGRGGNGGRGGNKPNNDKNRPNKPNNDKNNKPNNKNNNTKEDENNNDKLNYKDVFNKGIKLINSHFQNKNEGIDEENGHHIGMNDDGGEGEEEAGEEGEKGTEEEEGIAEERKRGRGRNRGRGRKGGSKGKEGNKQDEGVPEDILDHIAGDIPERGVPHEEEGEKREEEAEV